MSDSTGESPANIIGGIIGGVTGAALGTLLADALGLRGLKRWALIAAATVGGAVLGAFLGPYVAKLAKSFGSMIKTTVQAAKTTIRHTRTVTKLINNASKLKRSKTVMNHISSRPYINSTQTIQNIMKAAKPTQDLSLKNGLKWVVSGSYNGSYGVWELVINSATNTIVHFLFRSK